MVRILTATVAALCASAPTETESCGSTGEGRVFAPEFVGSLWGLSPSLWDFAGIDWGDCPPLG